MPRVVHFEIHAGDPERALNFYQALRSLDLSTNCTNKSV